MAKRNPNGEGTIYRRKDGRYEGAGYVLMPDGTRKRRRVYGNTWEEARKKLTEMLANSDKGIPAVDTTETLGSYLTYWLEHVAAHKVRASTVYSYSKCVNGYIVPRLGKKKLAQLSAKDVRLFLDWARQAPVLRPGPRRRASHERATLLCGSPQAVLRASAVAAHGAVPARSHP